MCRSLTYSYTICYLLNPSIIQNMVLTHIITHSESATHSLTHTKCATHSLTQTIYITQSLTHSLTYKNIYYLFRHTKHVTYSTMRSTIIYSLIHSLIPSLWFTHSLIYNLLLTNSLINNMFLFIYSHIYIFPMYILNITLTEIVCQFLKVVICFWNVFRIA